MKPIQISIYDIPAHCYNIEEVENDNCPWYQEILLYVKNREYPDQATENDKRTLRRLAIDYVLDGEILYKRGKDRVLLSTIMEVCNQFSIKHHNSSLYRPKMNGAMEVANKNIKKIVAKIAETYKDSHEKLPFALLSYRTSIRTSTGATPFSLVYEMKAVLPIEIEIPSLQKRMMRAYNKKVRTREFHEEDLVLKKILPLQKDFRGKWMPNCEGPYVVKKAFSGGALFLSEMDGQNLLNPVNSDSVKKYFT
ncbi:uncharacterized protein [Gossypium hirsutum]|uniref:Integrase catalytic domain-containing protein n=1 Tax=Gossypium hirsutum TaxID=3635 RepID=A0A1U8MYU9_GOSHI|nr:uncharacterized protein LOC107941671 [Gossypium hirsutum]